MSNTPLKLDPTGGLILGQIGNVAGGLTSIASGIIGSKRRRQEERDAQAEFDRYRAQFESTDTSNPYANMQNVYEDLTVNQQAAEAAKAQAQAQKALADTEYTMARTEETRADTIETLAGIERKERENVLNTAEQLQKVVQGSEIRQPPSRV